MPSVFPAIKANTLPELFELLGLPHEQSMATIENYNAACSDGEFCPSELDGLATSGVTPSKTNWARTIEQAPFFAYALKPGVTFTYLGVDIDETAKVSVAGQAAENLWAAGEIVAGNILGEGYLAGFGMTIGTVYGRIAGTQAGVYATA